MREYNPNPKHKDPWQPGRKGTLCYDGLDDDARKRLEAAIPALLGAAECDGDVLYQAFDGRAYQGAVGSDGVSCHGWPVGWVEVPDVLRRRWVREQRVRRSDIQRHWTVGGGR